MVMAPLSRHCTKKEANRGAWTVEEDQKLAQVIEIHGPKRWKSVAVKAGEHINSNLCFFFFLLTYMYSLPSHTHQVITKKNGG
jgi:hypothetical protein